MSMRKQLSALLFVFLILEGIQRTAAQNQIANVIGTPNNQHRVINSYPEYWVDSKPFFPHIANFNYYRLPRDRWAAELVRLQSMGINTLDFLPMWNWHQPEENKLDFSGQTNPQRDLDYLFRISQLMGFKVVLRPGPYDTNDWRNGGYPDWLLCRPEYHMSNQSILEGRFPPLSALQYENQEETAKGWLKNETHLKFAREWYRNVLGHLSPFLAEHGGPILAIQLEDDVSLGLENYSGPNFWKYMDTLRGFAKEATHASPIPYFLDAADMRVNAEANDATQEPFWNTGQDYQQVGEAYEISGQQGYSTTVEAANNKFMLETLKTQPLFVPAHTEFQAGWRILSTDTYASYTHPSNTLLASRVLFQNGLKGLGYFPMHDLLNPAGYEVQWTNHLYGFEAAVNYAGEETARAPYVRRNGRFLRGMGPLLASSHLLPDAGLVYPMATFPQPPLKPEEADYVGNEAARFLWSGIYEHYNVELVDSDHAPLQNFQRYSVLLLPNLVSDREDVKVYPHLEKYSDKAQLHIEQYVSTGGTLIVFPSLPKGEIFAGLLSPLGRVELIRGDGEIRFTDGLQARVLGRRWVVKLPPNAGTRVEVFARDKDGEVIGARFAYGKGQVLYFGGDFSLWSVPRGSGLAFRTGAHMSLGNDYPENVQQSARATLAGLMKEAGVHRKITYEFGAKRARDPELYVTELVEDADSSPFERHSTRKSGYGFVGVTNFSVDAEYSKQLRITSPRAKNLALGTSQFEIRLPLLNLPPRESVLLPIRIPLANPYWEMAPGLEPDDEVYYATSELSQVSYDGARLRLEFTAPADGEVALRLHEKPRAARVHSQPASLEEDAARRLWIVKIPKGSAPDYIQTVELAYPRPGPHISIEPEHSPWISGEKCSVRLRVENRKSSFAGILDFSAGTMAKAEKPVSVPAHATQELNFPVAIPADAIENQPVEIAATLRPKDSSTSWGWRSQVTIHRPFTFTVSPLLTFPMREDLSIPIVHPMLASVNLPGEAHFSINVKNWRAEEQTITVTAKGDDLTFDAASSRLAVPAQGEGTVNLKVTPRKGTGAYRFEIQLHAGSYQTGEGVVLVAIHPGEAIAYTLDYDRDGFDDVILENQKVRLFLSPFAGARSFGFVLKDSNANAFDSVGAMRDNFSMRIAPEDSKGLPDWSSVYRGLYNRPYSYRIVSGEGTEVELALNYMAPDIYPEGVKVERRLRLRGDEDVVQVDTTMTPEGIDKPQSYVLESSVPFRAMEGPNYNRWFCLPLLPSAQEFVPLKGVDLPLKTGVVGTVNAKTGEAFALMVVDPADKAQLSVQNHSALIRITYPSFEEAHKAYTYRAAYYFGHDRPDQIESLFAKLKSGEKP